MILAACGVPCGTFAPNAPRLLVWAVVGAICGVLVLGEVICLAVLRRRNGRLLRFHVGHLLLTLVGIGALIFTWQAVAAYLPYLHVQHITLRNDLDITGWDLAGTVTIGLSLVCLAVGGCSVLMQME